MEEQISQQPQQDLEESPIEDGGKIEGIDPSGTTTFHEKEHRADTERKLAYRLLWWLGGTWLLHYIVILVMEYTGKHDAAEHLSKAFSIWLPVISSLASSVVTYYFTREKR